MEVLSLLPKMCRVINGDSESSISSRPQDCGLQTKHLDLSLISSLVDATLNSLDDAILPSANRILQLQDAREELQAATGIEVTRSDICSFQERVGKSLSNSSKITYPASLDPPQKMSYYPSVF